MQKYFKLAVLAFCLFGLIACDNKAGSAQPNTTGFVGTDITGADFPKPLTLTDHLGNKRTMSDFAGKAVVLFFGYTHCPDVCPGTMSALKNTMKLLGDKADEVQVLFVTVDPARDTQQILAQFVPSFDKRFIGLWGSLQETAEMMGNFKIYYVKVAGKSADDYTIDHSSGIYVFDKAGKIRLYMGYGQKPADMANDISKIL